MPNLPPDADRFDCARRRALWFLGQAGLILGLWFGLMRVPALPASGLDSSWQMVIAHAATHSLQFGKDIVFTYGPLGFLMVPINVGSTAWYQLAWQLGANLAFAITIYCLGRSFVGLRKAAFYVFFFCYGTAYVDAIYMIMLVILSLSLAREQIIAKRGLAALIAAMIAVLASAKFTNLLLATFSIACLTSYYAIRRDGRSSAILAGSYVLAFIGIWVGFGQNLGNLVTYLSRSWEVSAGYVDAMGVEESTAMFCTGLGVAVLLGSYFGLTLHRPENRAKAVTICLIASAAAFLNWKHGFVRADGHVSAHFYLSLLFVCSFPVLLQDRGPWQRAKGTLLTACGVLCLAGIWQNSPPWITNAVAFFNLRVMDAAYTVARARDFGRNAREQFEAVRKTQQLPDTRRAVAAKPVDVIGNEQAYAFFNDLNYRPRPVFQSYGAYTESLARLNEEFMRSGRAPEFILQRVQTIDNRLPALDDSLVTRYLYRHYEYQLEEGGFLLWKRQPAQPEPDHRTLLTESSVGFGTMLSTPSLDRERPIWCEIDVRPSWLGRIRTLLYKPPLARLSVVDETGAKTSYRLVRGMAAAGFLLQPYLYSNYSIAHFATGGRPERLEKVGVEVDPPDAKYFRPDIHIRLYELPPFPRQKNPNLTALEVRYRVFSQPPVSATALFPPEVITENGKEALLTHPPSELEFRVGARTRQVSGKFGLVAKSYQGGNTTDGAEFIVDWIDADGKRTRLFYRHLQPLTQPQDRGEQSFAFTPPPGGGRMVLKITPGPNGNIAYDWTYWTDVKISE